MPDPQPVQPANGVAMLALLATALVGVLAIVAAYRQPTDARGICLIAAALAFGLLSNALWRR